MAMSCICDCSIHVYTWAHSWGWRSLGQESQAQRENEIGVSGRSHFLALKKMEVQSLEFRLSDHETESAEAEGPGS